MKEEINGIIIKGKVYISMTDGCSSCALQEECAEHDKVFINLSHYFGKHNITKAYSYKYSPKLTERINQSGVQGL